MSFCPTKDIHSVYLDNELPEEYIGDYEEHIRKCEKCRRELERLKAVKSVFQDDAGSMSLDKQFLDDSYQRLIIKMTYKKNLRKTKKPLLFKIGYAVSAAAAALLVAVFIPVGLKSKSGAVNPETSSVVDNMFAMKNLGNNISFGSGNNMLVSGKMGNNILSPGGYSYNMYNYSGLGGFDGFEVKLNADNELNSFGFLRPQFNGDNIITVRISLPCMDMFPVVQDEDIQSIRLSGNFLWNLQEN